MITFSLPLFNVLVMQLTLTTFLILLLIFALHFICINKENFNLIIEGILIKENNLQLVFIKKFFYFLKIKTATSSRVLEYNRDI